MSEENQPIPEPQPTEPIEVSTTPVSESPKLPNPTGDSKGRRGTLESLPKEVKADMEAFMKKKNPNAAAKYMSEKYGEQFPTLKKISKVSFRSYAQRHELIPAKELMLPPPLPIETLNVINSITDESISLEDKRAALTALYNASEAQNKLLWKSQANFTDPQIQAIIVANRKEQHALLKTLTTLNDQLTKDADKDWLSEAVSLTQVILAAVYNAYRLTHSDQSHFSEFAGKVDVSITASLKAYPTSIENLKKDTKNSPK
jgi:hypothetical protein